MAKKPAKAKPKPKAKVKGKAPPKPSRPTPPKPTQSGYTTHRDSMAAVSRAKSQSGREIGGIPPITNIERREACRLDLKLFMETYNPAAFSLAWGEDQIRSVKRIEEAVLYGALYAFAEPRGGGKTTRCRMGALWSIAYAHRRYPFLISATDDKARDTLDTLRLLIRFLPDFAADFPEISYPAKFIGGIAQRAGGQMCCGESTLIEWKEERIVLPTVPPPENWPKEWKLRADGKVPTSGVLVSAAGLTGEGLRGSLKTLSTGEMVRPDLVILDDPQTPESARSPTQNVTRLRLVSADVLGMAGPGKSIAAVMPCTVIEPGDMVDEVLDRQKHPLWRGERSGILRSMPTNMEAWERYFEVYARCALLEPPDFAESNAYYVEHQPELDAGSVASWPDRKGEKDASAIQHAMHLFFRDRLSFWAEYMNQPKVISTESASVLDPEFVAGKVTNLNRGIVPRACTRLTAMIDIDLSLLWFAVVAWDERFGGSVVSYGAYPDQGRPYFAKADARPTLLTLPAAASLSQEAAVYAGLTAVCDEVLGATYQHEETGAAFHVERCLIDANYGPLTELVYEFCRRSTFAGTILPSHGKFVGASSAPMSTWVKRAGEMVGSGWRVTAHTTGRGRHVVYDTNKWKTFTAERLRTPFGQPGCLSLHAPTRGGHRLIADHVAAEYPVKTEARERVVDEWKDRANRDNHYWDCLVGATVAASVNGLQWTAAAEAVMKGPKKKRDIEKMHAAANRV